MEIKKNGRPLGRPKTNHLEKPRNELILETAARLFLESGFQKVSIDDVAMNAGVTKATVYYYFDSKAELYKESIVSLMERIKGRIDLLMTSDKPLFERLLDVTTAHLQATTTLDLEAFMRESKTDLSDEQILEMRMVEHKMYEGIQDALQLAVDNGEIPKVNVTFATQSYLALIQVGNYKNPDGTPIFSSIEETTENILNIFWKGFFS
ncbi:TetR/AcrR family transcriptional regulator [Heyndrickxia oleronia]|uniref:TetR/AcrR family transcriptional regulator n=1 Tax=Heyndrickxia oleronia TaxID=38875 RepID=A0AAW6SZH2_9BACI|nr:TetR/AcrR family transcriptional regulator [Heyndrickxia oleronia]MDH5164141.1 TetR/AcrR family transcriptional regulator [Heyndrickxia oleronia]